MFGLSTKEVLCKVITNACYNCKNVYKNALLERMDELNSSDDEKANRIVMEIRRTYLDEVANSVIESFRLSSPAIYARIQLALLSPAMCGYADLNIDDGLIAGGVFAICYFAMKNRIAPAKMCIKLNHIQNDIMEKVLYEIADEM